MRVGRVLRNVVIPVGNFAAARRASRVILLISLWICIWSSLQFTGRLLADVLSRSKATVPKSRDLAAVMSRKPSVSYRVRSVTAFRAVTGSVGSDTAVAAGLMTIGVNAGRNRILLASPRDGMTISRTSPWKPSVDWSSLDCELDLYVACFACLSEIPEKQIPATTGQLQ
jgi:hypothetical protein